MASKKTDQNALQKLREKVRNENTTPNNNTIKSTSTKNEGTSRTIKSSALTPSGKSDPKALQKLREKVAKEKTSVNTKTNTETTNKSSASSDTNFRWEQGDYTIVVPPIVDENGKVKLHPNYANPNANSSYDAKTGELLKRLETATNKTTEDYFKKRYQEEVERLKKEHSNDPSFPVGAHADGIVSNEVRAAKKEIEKIKRELDNTKGGYKDSWFKSGTFDDGYQFGDAAGATLATVGDVGLGAVKGVGRLAEGLVDLGTYGVGYVGKLFGADDFWEDAKKTARYSATDEWTKGMTDYIDQYSLIGNKGDSITEGLGQLGGIIATAGAASVAGLSSAGVSAVTTGTMGLSSMGTSMGEAYEAGATDGEAVVYGLGIGAIDVISEIAFGGLGKGVSALGVSRGIGGLDDIFAKKISNKIAKAFTNEAVQRVAGNTIEFAIKSGGEGLEELAAGAGSAVMKNLTYMDDKELTELLKDEKLLDQFIVGTVVSSIAQSPQYISANKNGTDFVTGQTIQQEHTVDNIVDDIIAEREKKGEKVTFKEKNRIYDEVTTKLENNRATPDSLEQAARDVVEERRKASGVEVSESRKRGKVTATMLNTLSENNVPITKEEVKKVTGFGDNGAELVAKYSNENGATFDKVVKEVRASYLTGFNHSGVDIKTAAYALNSDAQKNAYTAGQMDAVMQNREAEIKSQNARVFGDESGIIDNEHSEQRTPNELKMANIIGEDLGSQVSFEERLIVNEEKKVEANAWHQDGEIKISNNSDNKFIEDIMEESLHRIMEIDTEAARVLKTAAYDFIAEGERIRGMEGLHFDSEKSLYDNAGQPINTRGIVEEVSIVPLASELFRNEKEWMRWRKKLDTDPQLRTAWQKFVDVVYEIIEKIRRLLDEGSFSKETRAKVNKDLADLERLKGLYGEAYKATRDEVNKRTESKTMQNNNTNSTKNLEIKINEEYNGNINHSLKNSGKTKSEQYGVMWTLDEGVLNDNEVANFYEKISETKNNKYHNYHKAANGQYIYEIENKLVYTDGDYDYPHISKVVEFNTTDNYWLEYGKESFYDGEKYRYPTESIVEIVEAVLGEGAVKTTTYESYEANKRSGKSGSKRKDGTKTNRRSQKDVDKSYSLKDSNGNTLTKEQAEYFKDSKVRDENGNLLVMYHGTPEDFTVFDKKKARASGTYGRGFYFTREDNHARHYGKPKEYYLKIDNPLSTKEKTITKLQLEKFLEVIAKDEDYGLENYGYGSTVESVIDRIYDDYDASYPEYRKTDFSILQDINLTAIGNLVEAVELFNDVNGTNFDGFILPTETVIFNSEQAKLTTNKKPTNNPDINFSLKQSVEETKNLIALHNVREDKLFEALKLGGLPSPSIAITKKDMLFDKFGDISLIFRKDTISPTDRRNKIYSGDAYTPTGVRVEYDIDDDILQEFNKKLKELTPEFTNERLPSVDSGTAQAENDSLYKAYERNDRAKFAFLREKGKAPKVAMRTPTLSGFATNDAIIALAKAFSSKQLNDIANTTEGVKQYKNACLKVIRDNSDSRVVESGIYSADSVSLWDVADVARLAAKVKENKYKIKKEVDNRAIYDLIDKKFTNALKAEYKTWIDENTRDAIIDKGIRNNRDLFTPSGNRRSFKQLHEPYNLSNIVKQMFSGEDKGIALFGGSPIGAAQHLYSSIADVKADSGRIQDLEQEEYDKIRDSIEDDIFELARKMQINSDVFAVRDLLTEAIGKKTKQQADLHLKRESQGWAKYSPEFTNELWDIRERILNMPTQYFEAKPQRAVGFNEVVAAIIPRNKDKSLKTELENRGIKVLEYSKEKDGDRLKKINSVSDVSFSLKGTNNTNYKDHQDLVNTIEHLKNEFKVTKFAKADPKKLETMTKKLLKEYSSQAEFDDVFSSIDELYGYIANGEDGHPAVWDEVYRRAYNVSQNILDNAVAVYDELYKEYKDLREYLRSVPMKFDTKYDELPSGYDSFNEFRRNNFGRLNFRKDGTSIDGVYQELSSLYPEYFDSNRETDTSAQLDKIVETLDSLQPTEYNPYSDDMKLAASFLANDIIDNFFDIPQAKPTFADKAEQRVNDARISGIHKVEVVRKQRDAKIQKLMASQRAKIKKLIEKSKQSKEKAVDKEKAKRKATLDRMSETKKASVIRAKIIRHTGELNKTLLKATDKKHIPPELENAVLTLLYNINMESNYSYDVKTHSYKKNNEGLPTNKTKAFQQLKAVYEEIAKNNDYGLTIASELYDATNAGIGNIFDELMKLSDKKIADMTSEELTKVYDAIRLVEHSIATANKMFAMQKWENLTQTAKAFEKSVATRRPMPSLFNKRGTLDIETPITFFSHFGEAGMELYQALRDAQDNEQTMIDTLAEHIQGIVSLEQVQKAEKELFEFTTASGEKLTLSKAHIMDIYLLYNRNQGKKHLLYDPESEHFGNGIHQPEIKSKHIRRATESTRLTKGDIGNILSKLTEEDKAIANKMQKATLLLAEWGNKACMDVFGYEKFKDPNYWTIKSAQESINQTLEKNKDIARAIKNMGSAKPIEDKATNALDIGGVFNVFNQHASDMISYSAWLGVMEDATKLYNYTFRDDDGFKTNKTFKGMLDKYAGNGGNKYYFNLLKDIQNGIGIAPDTSIENFYTKLFGMATKAKVAFKLTVVAQQPMAIVRATDVLNPVSIAKAIGKGGLNLPVWAASKVKNISTKDSGKLLNEWYGGWERALKYSPIAKRKSIGGYEINSNSSGLKDVLYKPETVKGKVIDAAKESPLWAAGKADQITWGILWNACEIETDKTTSFEKGSDAYYEDVNKLFTKVINETQVVDGVLQRSQMMRSSSGWVKPLTAFKGEPTMALNGVLRAYDNLRYETNPSKRGKAIKKFSRATTVFVMSAIFTAFARSLAVGVTGEDDEEYWKKVWKSFSGIQGDEETWFDFVKNIGLKSDAVNNVNPLSWLPGWSELMSFAQGYDVERLDVASINDFLQAGIKVVDSLDDEGKYKTTYATRNLLLKLSELTGYSPYNLVRDIEGAIRTVRVETNDVKGLYDMEKWRTKPAANVSKYIDILYKAYTTDEEAYDYIYNDLIENGVDAEKIKSGMEIRMKKDEGVEKASDLSKRYMTPDVEKKYDNSLKKIKNSSTWKSANASERKEAEESLYNFLTSPSDAMEKTRKEARAYGVDETEYTLMQLAKEMVNDDKPSMNAKEKAEAIKMLDLGNSELAYFYNTETADKAYENGVDIENFAMFKSAVSGLKGDNKKAMVDSYAEKYSRNTKEYLFFMGTEYPSYKKRRDYISYFGK